MDTDPSFETRGLQLVDPPDQQELERELVWLHDTNKLPSWQRWLGYLRRGGPGYLQSALTLGGGSAAAALFAGAAFGYELLWVAPTGMLIGMVMMMAIAHQTLSTGMRPFQAMRTYAGPVFAWGWAIGAVLASCIWHFSQYALASSLGQELFHIGGLDLPRWVIGLLILIWAVVSAQMFATGNKGMRSFETLLKSLVWLIVLCFAWTVWHTGVDWSAAFSGLFSFSIPAQSAGGVDGLSTVIAGLGAAVVVNMVFLYPYTLLARGWGREHRKLARFDLFTGMLLPYVLATGLMVIATANTLHASGAFMGTRLSPLEVSKTLAPVLGEGLGTAVFLCGLLGMVLTTITMHMVSAGFALAEMFNLKFGTTAYRWALMVPVPGFLGCFFWDEIVVWVAVPTSIATGFLLPLAYIGFIKLQRSDSYLGSDRPSGGRGRLILGAMILATSVMVSFLGWYLVTRVL